MKRKLEEIVYLQTTRPNIHHRSPPFTSRQEEKKIKTEDIWDAYLSSVRSNASALFESQFIPPSAFICSLFRTAEQRHPDKVGTRELATIVENFLDVVDVYLIIKIQRLVYMLFLKDIYDTCVEIFIYATPKEILSANPFAFLPIGPLAAACLKDNWDNGFVSLWSYWTQPYCKECNTPVETSAWHPHTHTIHCEELDELYEAKFVYGFRCTNGGDYIYANNFDEAAPLEVTFSICPEEFKPDMHIKSFGYNLRKMCDIDPLVVVLKGKVPSRMKAYVALSTTVSDQKRKVQITTTPCTLAFNIPPNLHPVTVLFQHFGEKYHYDTFA